MFRSLPLFLIVASHFAGQPGWACENDDHRSSTGVSNHPDVPASCTGLSGESHWCSRFPRRLHSFDFRVGRSKHVLTLQFYEGYGQTECTAGCSMSVPGDWSAGEDKD